MVMRAIAVKPNGPYSAAPAGATSANAAYMAVPIQAITRPVFSGPASVKPHACAPVMTKLSPAPSRPRRPAKWTQRCRVR